MVRRTRPLEEVQCSTIYNLYVIYIHTYVGVNWLLDSIREKYNEINEKVIADVALQVQILWES